MAAPLKILHTLGAARAGGAELFFVRLMVALSASTEVEILPVVRKGSWAAERLREAGIRFEEAWFGGWWDILTRRKLERLAQDFKADVVQSWMNRATKFTPTGRWVRVARLGGYYNLKYYFKNTDYLIGNTQDICDYCIQHGWPETRVKLIGNFVPRPEKRDAKVRRLVRVEQGIPARAKVLMMAARLHEVKGWDVLLKALAKLDKDVWVLAGGAGPDEERLKELAKKLGVAERVAWAGWQNDVGRYATAADVWVVASRQEPLGNSVLDAWVHGVPVVATKSKGPAKLITDGANGLLVAVDDAAALAKKVASVLMDKKTAKELVAGGERELQENHAEAVVVARYVAYYKAITEKSLRGDKT